LEGIVVADNQPSGSITFKGKRITKDDIMRVASRESPKRVNSYFVEIGGKRYPPKQLVESATGISTTEFDSQVAVRLLESLGCTVERVPPRQ